MTALDPDIEPDAETGSEGGDSVAPGEPDEADGVEEAGDAPTRRRPRLGSWTFALLALSVIAVVAAYLSWDAANTDPEQERAALRDLAVIEGTAAIETMNTMDYREVDAGLEAWRSVTTGVLHDQLVALSADERQLLAEQGKVATGRVVEAALTDLTDRTATMIAALEVSVADQDPSVEATVKRNRYTADLVLVEGEWKLENLAQVPVLTS